MVYKQKNKTHYALTFVIAFPIFIITGSLVEMPSSIKTVGEVFPKEKWIIVRDNGGQIISNLIDFSDGHSAQFNISQFERGEFVSGDFNKYLKNKKNILKGDTIVCFNSSNVADQLIDAENELSVAVANLKSQSSPQKQPLIDEAVNRMNYIKEKYTEQKIVFDRTKKLFEKGYCSQQEFELQKWNLDLLEIEGKIYNSQIDNLSIGVKEEEKQFLETKIMSARKRLDFLKNRESQLVLKSPIEGCVISSFSPDTLLNVVNCRSVVLHMPVKVSDLPQLHEHNPISISLNNIKQTAAGTILSIEKEVKIVNNQQAVFISILLDNNKLNLLPGMLLDSSLVLRKITLIEHLYKLISG